MVLTAVWGCTWNKCEHQYAHNDNVHTLMWSRYNVDDVHHWFRVTTSRPEESMNVRTTCHVNPSNSCRDISLKTTYVNLMVVPEENNSSSHPLWISAPELMRISPMVVEIFSHQIDWLTDWQSDTAIRGVKMSSACWFQFLRCLLFSGLYWISLGLGLLARQNQQF